MENPAIYTIGHSTHSPGHFLELLKMHAIDSLVDVRSVAASRYTPHFNRQPLSKLLQRNSIFYLHFAAEFGARQTDPQLLDEEGKVDFEKVRASAPFKSGVQRLRKGMEKGLKIVLMCAESYPLDCHRFSMISPDLVGNGFEVNHILKDGSLKINQQLEEELLNAFYKEIPKPTIFNPGLTHEEQLKIAYRFKNREIAFSPNSTSTHDAHD